MTNINMSIKGSILTVKIDLSEDHGPSKTTGKTNIVATTHGPKPMLKPYRNISLGINCFKHPNKDGDGNAIV